MKTKLLIPLLLFSVFSCARIDELNDYNTVASFEITEHKGAEGGEITLGEVTVMDSEVHIPVTDGVDNFPLMFKGAQ